MLIKEITQPAVVEPEPTDKEVADITALLGTIDPVKEQPQTLLNKLTGWMKQYPVLDKVTDIIPQTRLIKAIAAAADAIEAGDSKTALTALAGVVGGGVAQLSKAVNVGTALAQGDVNQAALAAGGTVSKVAKAANTVDKVQTALLPKATVDPATVAQTQTDEVERIRQLSKVQGLS
jgi:hypothetical protein